MYNLWLVSARPRLGCQHNLIREWLHAQCTFDFSSVPDTIVRSESGLVDARRQRNSALIQIFQNSECGYCGENAVAKQHEFESIGWTFGDFHKRTRITDLEENDLVHYYLNRVHNECLQLYRQ